MGPDDAGESEYWIPVAATSAPAKRPRLHGLSWNWFGKHDKIRKDRKDTRPLTPGKFVALVMLGSMVLLLVAELALAAIDLAGSGGAQGLPDADLLIAGSLFNIVFFTVPPLVWVLAFYKGGLRAWGTRLLLRTNGLWLDVAIGIVGAIALVLAAILLVAVYVLVGGSAENPAVEALAPELTWTAIIIVSLSAGISEEVFFRGFLQARIGVVPANLAFGVVHLNYGTPVQVFLPALLGFVFSWMTLRRASLLPAIIAHAGFDFIMLTATMLSSGAGFPALV